MFTYATAAVLALGTTLWSTVPASVQPQRDDELNAAIAAAGERQEPIVTKADKAMIAAKCGYRSDWDGDNISLDDGVLKCADGRKIDDPETRAMAKAISARAKKYVEGVMSDPAVKRAMDGTIERETRAALAKARAALARAGFAKD